MEQADLVTYIEQAEESKYGIKFHVNGDAAVQTTLNALEEVANTMGLSQSYFLEHAALIDDDDYARINILGVCASVQPPLALVGEYSDQADFCQPGRP